METYNYHNMYGEGRQMELSATFSRLMRNVYAWMAAGLAMTALTALVVSGRPELMFAIANNSLIFWALMIGELGMVFYLSARIHKLSFATAGILFAVYAVLNGVTMSFLFLIYAAQTIATTFAITAGTFATMSIIGFFTSKDLSNLGRTLIMLLIGLIIASVVNIFVASSGLAMIINYVGVLVFVGLTAWDTQKIRNMLIVYSEAGINDQTNKLALLGSFSLYLDFINLFIHLLRIVGGNRD